MVLSIFMPGGDRGTPIMRVYLIKNRHREVYEAFCRHSLAEVGISLIPVVPS